MPYRALIILSSLFACLALGQNAKQTATYTYDVNGNRVYAVGGVAAGPYRAETLQSINGRTVPVESVEEVVLSENSSGRIVERIVKKFDSTGQQTGTSRIRIEEKNLGAGHTSSSTSVYEKDLNGSFALRQRTVAETVKTGEVEKTETRLEQPSINGTLDLQELRIAVATGNDKERYTDITTLRRDTNNTFKETMREIVQAKTEDNKTTVSTSVYDAAGTGKMSLKTQTTSRTTKHADGGESQVVEIFGSVPDGRTADFDRTSLKLREQHVVDKKAGADQSLVETFSIRRADLDSGRLGPAVKVSETRCTGSCLPAKP
jgi:hypothetical protein